MSVQDPAVERRMRHIDHLEAAQPERFCYARLVFNSSIRSPVYVPGASDDKGPRFADIHSSSINASNLLHDSSLSLSAVR